MSNQTFRCRVVKWALWIVTATVLLWAVPVDLLYGKSGLQWVGSKKVNVNTVMGLHHVAPAHSVWAVLLTVGGSICALIATTNAAVSFSSGLCGEWIACSRISQMTRISGPCKWRLTLGFIILCTLAGAVLLGFGTSVMGLVHVLSSSASVTIIVVIPWLTPTRRPLLMGAIALICAFVGAALSIYLDVCTPDLGTVMRGIAVMFALAPLVAATFAIRRLVTGPPAPREASLVTADLAQPELARVRA